MVLQPTRISFVYSCATVSFLLLILTAFIHLLSSSFSAFSFVLFVAMFERVEHNYSQLLLPQSDKESQIFPENAQSHILHMDPVCRTEGDEDGGGMFVQMVIITCHTAPL
jgi:hypothetical protein